MYNFTVQWELIILNQLSLIKKSPPDIVDIITKGPAGFWSPTYLEGPFAIAIPSLSFTKRNKMYYAAAPIIYAN